MSVTAAAGIFSFGPQPDMGVPATDFYRHRGTLIDLGVQDDVREGAPEVGGIPTPTFPYKAGVMCSGGAVIQPRLENSLGWLLYGALGKVTSTESPGGGGMYNHKFEMTTDATLVPWMTFRKAIPRRQGGVASDLGEQYEDGKLLGLALTLASDAPVTARLDALTRTFSLDHDPAAWVYANEFEDWQSIPVGCKTEGYIKIDGESLPIVSAQVGWQNVPLDPRQERVYGSPYLEDVTVTQRRFTYDLMVKWNNPALYAKLLTGSAVGTAWSGNPFTGTFTAKTVSSRNMPTEVEPYSLIMEAAEVMMSQVGGIQLAANQSIMMRFQGVALANANYASFTLRNKQASYTWPVVGSGS